jgi:hypothetical protein
MNYHKITKPMLSGSRCGNRAFIPRTLKVSCSPSHSRFPWPKTSPLLTSFFFLIFFGSTGVCSQGFTAASQVLYQLSHVTALFCFSNFSNRVSHLHLHWPGSQPSYLCFPCGWNDRHAPPCSDFIGWGGVSWTFFLDWPRTVIFCLLSS